MIFVMNVENSLALHDEAMPSVTYNRNTWWNTGNESA